MADEKNNEFKGGLYSISDEAKEYSVEISTLTTSSVIEPPTRCCICFLDGDLMLPCTCQFIRVHLTCLNIKRVTSNDPDDFKRCKRCKFEYQYESDALPRRLSFFKRQPIRYIWKCLGEIIHFLLLNITLMGFFAGIIAAFDEPSQRLPSLGIPSEIRFFTYLVWGGIVYVYIVCIVMFMSNMSNYSNCSSTRVAPCYQRFEQCRLIQLMCRILGLLILILSGMCGGWLLSLYQLIKEAGIVCQHFWNNMAKSRLVDQTRIKDQTFSLHVLRD